MIISTILSRVSGLCIQALAPELGNIYSGRRGAGPCGRVVMQAFVAGQEPDKDCSGDAVAVSKLPYYLQRAFYQAKEAEPIDFFEDASAQTGEGAESPAPDVESIPEEIPPEEVPAPPPEPAAPRA